jgi:hypothetical protein
MPPCQRRTDAGSQERIVLHVEHLAAIGFGDPGISNEHECLINGHIFWGSILPDPGTIFVHRGIAS